MIRSIYFAPNNTTQQNVSPADFKKLLEHEPAGILWVDFQGEPNESSEPILRDVFGFHPLAIDDALRETHVPKVDDWDDYLYVVLHAVGVKDHALSLLGSCELDVFLGKNFVVTHHDEKIDALDRVWDSSPRDTRNLKLGADHILYHITDELVVDYMFFIENVDEEIESLEDRIFASADPHSLERIFTLKRSVIQLRRTLSPQREVLNRLARDDFQVIDEKDQVYFRDVYDHMVRLHDITEGLRDLVSGSLDTYLSVVNNRMNDIMKTLTIITTMFMPISFLAGFFGMNFFAPDPTVQLYDWVSRPSFVIALSIMIITPITMLFWVRRRGWM